MNKYYNVLCFKWIFLLCVVSCLVAIVLIGGGSGKLLLSVIIPTLILLPIVLLKDIYEFNTLSSMRKKKSIDELSFRERKMLLQIQKEYKEHYRRYEQYRNRKG